MNEVKEDLEAPAVESAELTKEALGGATGGNAPLADEPEGEALDSGSHSGSRHNITRQRRDKKRKHDW